MSQSRRMSAVEICVSTAVGYVVAVATQFAVFPAFGLRVGVADNAVIGLIFTAVSLVRGYVLRRVFNHFCPR